MKSFILILITSFMLLSAHSASTSNKICPVMNDEWADSKFTMEYQGQSIAFCCKDCRRDFAKNPEKFTANLSKSVQAAFTDTLNATVDKHMESQGHDHQMSHGEVQSKKSVLEFLGRFHPIAVHLPIGLILGALFTELFFVFSKNSFFENASTFMLVMGSVTTVGAACLGWLAGMNAHYPGELMQVLEIHRWLGVSTTIFAIIASACRLLGHKLDSPKLKKYSRILLIITAMLVATTGHFGGTLIYGLDYFSW